MLKHSLFALAARVWVFWAFLPSRLRSSPFISNPSPRRRHRLRCSWTSSTAALTTAIILTAITHIATTVTAMATVEAAGTGIAATIVVAVITLILGGFCPMQGPA
jgi:energy-converting hydrogenase Eha subunit A